MITKFSRWLATIIAEKAERNDVDYLRFGIEITLSTLSKLVIFIFLASILGIFSQVFVILVSFALFRIFSGGVHMTTYLRCLTTSIIMFITPAFGLKHLANEITPTSLNVMTFLLVLLTVHFYVPVSASNNLIPTEKHHFFKRTSYIFIIIWFLVTLIINLYLSDYQYLSFFSSIGILLQTFTLTPFGYSILSNLDRILQSKKRLGVKMDEKGV